MQAEPQALTHHVVPLAGIEGRLPPEMASKAENDGIAKAGQDTFTLMTLGVLGGAFIAFGAIFSNVALAGSQNVMSFGFARVVAGLVFGVGLSLVLLAGAQIFTGDVLMVMAWANRRLETVRVVRAWCLVWIGNFIGAVSTALIVFLAGHHQFGGGLVGLNALQTAASKSALPFGKAVLLGILCNVLVCLAVWISLSTRLPAPGRRRVLASLSAAARRLKSCNGRTRSAHFRRSAERARSPITVDVDQGDRCTGDLRCLPERSIPFSDRTDHVRPISHGSISCRFLQSVHAATRLMPNTSG